MAFYVRMKTEDLSKINPQKNTSHDIELMLVFTVDGSIAGVFVLAVSGGPNDAAGA
tara:strand:- start:18 stop:185 length:168 start_codon:yes stop_codon:yes gene_type:complete